MSTPLWSPKTHARSNKWVDNYTGGLNGLNALAILADTQEKSHIPQRQHPTQGPSPHRHRRTLINIDDKHGEGGGKEI